MKRTMTATATALVLLLGAIPAWAGPVEEVTELAAKRGQAFSEGNADAYVADYAEDGVFTSSRATFRIEGKPAIRAFFAGLFQTYPQRRSVSRQVTSRVYGNDTIVVVDAYADQVWVDRNGQTTTPAIRTSAVWVKIGGRWLTVDSHLSRVPGPR
jgi:uncharacterized protein (TIGR02246 family)